LRRRTGRQCVGRTSPACQATARLAANAPASRAGDDSWTARRQAFLAERQGVLTEAARDRHLLVYLDEAHIHQDTDLGYGWAARGQRLWVASSSPGLAAKVSFYGLYLYNEGAVRLWPYPRTNSEHTSNVLRRLRAEYPDRALVVLWDGAPYHRAGAVREGAAGLGIQLLPLPGYSPDLMPVEAL
jgi:hypothetical protein